jgi:hypothetical protein
VNTARVVQVIVTDLAREGRGIHDDPVSAVKQLWTLDGELIVEMRMTSQPTGPRLGPGFEKVGEPL